jgi:hypothetical protein
MALSPQDQAYWKEKLGWKGFGFLLASTMIIGCVIWPLLLFVQDWLRGHAGDWAWSDGLDIAKGNFSLALLVTVIMWFFGWFFYWMRWLPSRR